ncbi:hypothetical protein PMIN01_04286 [Paraphaeosphaeria minitans]|uniref:Uncharacterized protein n=1 Tax=Paraphaeosphaeria minitans TaxID=565426 RepID=A0A9P6KRR7_9PLEO|nr:hypothetical protein PMIN01_04286 [Paraphaeosphaeria minitans]
MPVYVATAQLSLPRAAFSPARGKPRQYDAIHPTTHVQRTPGMPVSESAPCPATVALSAPVRHRSASVLPSTAKMIPSLRDDEEAWAEHGDAVHPDVPTHVSHAHTPFPPPPTSPPPPPARTGWHAAVAASPAKSCQTTAAHEPGWQADDLASHRIASPLRSLGQHGRDWKRYKSRKDSKLEWIPKCIYPSWPPVKQYRTEIHPAQNTIFHILSSDLHSAHAHAHTHTLTQGDPYPSSPPKQR